MNGFDDFTLESVDEEMRREFTGQVDHLTNPSLEEIPEDPDDEEMLEEAFGLDEDD